ncbi:SDR family oxidoreductase [Algiphilus aromaticivorans]|jgi:NAD(P)-dependent dehydrogenase (short-subunit alcohol dehydrogenase family)|uniref:SDR family oxidoreductase n=1 Tax=Algiphilus aromaticivorans TaxID=382454 RepID=UPI0005C16C9C|nr:SDR family oxidoreductase [Algiphilus aromaticivorans]
MAICEGRNVIITGAGAGLGRAHALALAAEGAAVLINDINHEAAEAVVAEITGAGGRAVANGDDITSVAGAEAIVAAAESAFGDVHAVVNNAGVLRDKMFASMSEDDWDIVIKVHLKGHFCISNVLVKRWRAQVKERGEKVNARIINTTSGAGLQGSIGQSNYGAAKGGIATLTLIQAAELGRYGITANALAPAARTGMTEDVFADVMKKPDDGFDHFAPENVSPIVVWLCSAQSAQVSGRVFEADGGRISVADGWRTGEVQDKSARWEPAEIGEAVQQLIGKAPAPQKVYGT